MIPPPLGIRAVDSGGVGSGEGIDLVLGSRRRWCRQKCGVFKRHPAEAIASAWFQEVVG